MLFRGLSLPCGPDALAQRTAITPHEAAPRPEQSAQIIDTLPTPTSAFGVRFRALMAAEWCHGARIHRDSSERKARLRADTDGAVLTLEPEDFESLIETHPWLVYKVMRALFRVTHTNLMRMNLESAELRNYMMKTGGRY